MSDEPLDLEANAPHPIFEIAARYLAGTEYREEGCGCEEGLGSVFVVMVYDSSDWMVRAVYDNLAAAEEHRAGLNDSDNTEVIEHNVLTVYHR